MRVLRFRLLTESVLTVNEGLNRGAEYLIIGIRCGTGRKDASRSRMIPCLCTAIGNQRA